jgi:hypothetical protein
VRKTVGIFVAGLSLAAVCAPVNGQDLPRSGSISWHTGWKLTAEAMTVAEGQVEGHGTAIGTSFNDKGAGPLHLGAAECVIAFFVIKGSGSNVGYCSFGDADGDRIFTEFTGKLGLPNGYDEGTNVISGGTGKYAGITGRGPWKCKTVGGNGGIQCAQRLDYRLP